MVEKQRERRQRESQAVSMPDAGLELMNLEIKT